LAQAETFFDFKLRVLLSRHDSQTIEGRAKISSAMLETVAKFHNAVIRSEYVKRLASVLCLSEEALIFEFKKILTSPSQHKREPAKTTAGLKSSLPVRPVERDMLRLLLNEQGFVPLTKELLSLSDFHNEDVRTVVSKVFELYEEKQEVHLSDLMCCFENQNILQMISHLVADDQFIAGDKDRVHKDCLHRLRQDRLKMIRQDILHQMRQADQKGDAQRLEELMLEFNRIVKN